MSNSALDPALTGKVHEAVIQSPPMRRFWGSRDHWRSSVERLSIEMCSGMKPTVGMLLKGEEMVMLSRVSGSIVTLWAKPPAAWSAGEMRTMERRRRSRIAETGRGR